MRAALITHRGSSSRSWPDVSPHSSCCTWCSQSFSQSFQFGKCAKGKRSRWMKPSSGSGVIFPKLPRKKHGGVTIMSVTGKRVSAYVIVFVLAASAVLLIFARRAAQRNKTASPTIATQQPAAASETQENSDGTNREGSEN